MIENIKLLDLKSEVGEVDKKLHRLLKVKSLKSLVTDLKKTHQDGQKPYQQKSQTQPLITAPLKMESRSRFYSYYQFTKNLLKPHFPQNTMALFT